LHAPPRAKPSGTPAKTFPKPHKKPKAYNIMALMLSSHPVLSRGFCAQDRRRS
jgi:hypothetical protein